jgi:hypothetical protein
MASVEAGRIHTCSMLATQVALQVLLLTGKLDAGSSGTPLTLCWFGEEASSTLRPVEVRKQWPVMLPSGCKSGSRCRTTHREAGLSVTCGW